MPVFIEHVVASVLWDVVLEQTEAVTVDRADIHRAEAVENGGPLPLLHALQDAVLQLERGPFCEGERHDRIWRGALVNQGRDALGDGPGLP